MRAFGKEYPLVLTVGAMEEITARCPDRDIGRLKDLLDGSTNDVVDFMVDFIAALSRGAEQQRSFQAMVDGGIYSPNPITPEMLRALSQADFTAAQTEAFRIWRGDQQPTVEVAEAKKNEDAAPAPVSV